MNHAYDTYNTVDVNTSNPLKIVLMLYDGAISFLNKAVEHAEKKDIKNKNIFANQARDIIVELNNSLDSEAGGEIAKSLRGLYNYMNRRLMKANWDNDIDGLNEVINLLSKIREAWQDVYEQKSDFFPESRQQAFGIRI
jgi:flagellar protein FliS